MEFWNFKNGVSPAYEYIQRIINTLQRDKEKGFHVYRMEISSRGILLVVRASFAIQIWISDAGMGTYTQDTYSIPVMEEGYQERSVQQISIPFHAREIMPSIQPHRQIIPSSPVHFAASPHPQHKTP